MLYKTLNYRVPRLQLQTLLQHALPHKLLAKIAFWCAECRIVWIKNFLINYFIKRYPVKMQEAIEQDPFAYACYNDFFTRKLKPSCRPIASQETAIVSPADGCIAQLGSIQETAILQAKQHEFCLHALLGGQQGLTDIFTNGEFATIYLAPKDYHRVHMPLAGTLRQMLYIPGKLYSVGTFAADNIPGLFAKNERVVSIFETPHGPMAVILVGAMIVGSIETVWAGTITPPHSQMLKLYEYPPKKVVLNKGDELGRFKLGSTVIVLFPKGVVKWTLPADTDVRFGQTIGEKNVG